MATHIYTCMYNLLRTRIQRSSNLFSFSFLLRKQSLVLRIMACSVMSERKLSVAVVLLFVCAGTWMVEARRPHGDLSIVGYAPEDLESRDRLMELFEEWVAKYRKAYASFEEKVHRLEVFEDNLKHIDEVNRNASSSSSSYWLGLNAFADLTHDEFKAAYLGLRRSGPNDDEEEEEKEEDNSGFRYGGVSFDEVPKSVDWRAKGAVTEVKNQGRCGSCWAFSTVAAVEGINQIVTGNLTSLSEQELIDCSSSKEYGNHGCSGGMMDYAFKYIARTGGGLRTEASYPYLMKEGECGGSDPSSSSSAGVVTISGYEDVPRNDERALIKALARQPVSVAIEASGRHFQFYRGGVFDGPCGTELDHGVAAVGYGTDKSKGGDDYIIVKNSWGAEWGEKGYIRMKRGTGNRHGLCGINKMASYPTK